ncbi:MAG: dienelactone hydrolase family protein [Brevundimonas sp.]|uniref:dienelactone hydrolase family protein n=1 Tax=Brevundimonas sp. TaxID=1871086 RepID=UPI00184D6D53|nr:dienelactone hydrolase family protein [Brevundimonas sp.]MBA4804905.1 dienelactone hydrolase family protein [Brevundimonas sp.]
MKRLMIAAALAAAWPVAGAAQEPAAAAQEPAAAVSPAPPQRVTFPSLDDGRTELVGYLYAPARADAAAPAVVLMHGRAGAYSTLADGVYDASTLSQRHQFWARYWAGRGYYALIVDGFGPRGYPGGFGRGSYSQRPAAVNEVTVRPLDAYGALQYLRTLPGVDDDRIGLMGWSNGGSATLATMADDKPGDMRRLGFRAAIAMYPACGLHNRFDRTGYSTYAPVRVFMGTDDEEVSHDRCRDLIGTARARGHDVEFTSYRGATHSFDDPGRRRQSVAANARATADVRQKLGEFFDAALAPRAE